MFAHFKSPFTSGEEARMLSEGMGDWLLSVGTAVIDATAHFGRVSGDDSKARDVLHIGQHKHTPRQLASRWVSLPDATSFRLQQYCFYQHAHQLGW